VGTLTIYLITTQQTVEGHYRATTAYWQSAERHPSTGVPAIIWVGAQQWLPQSVSTI